MIALAPSKSLSPQRSIVIETKWRALFQNCGSPSTSSISGKATPDVAPTALLHCLAFGHRSIQNSGAWMIALLSSPLHFWNASQWRREGWRLFVACFSFSCCNMLGMPLWKKLAFKSSSGESWHVVPSIRKGLSNKLSKLPSFDLALLEWPRRPLHLTAPCVSKKGVLAAGTFYTSVSLHDFTLLLPISFSSSLPIHCCLEHTRLLFQTLHCFIAF